MATGSARFVRFQSSSVFWHVSGLHFVRLPNSMPTRQLVDTWGFCLLATVNNAARRVPAQVSVWTRVSVSPGCGDVVHKGERAPNVKAEPAS